MSVVGFDIGNESCVIAVARRSRVDILLNDELKHETLSVVSFGEKQRIFGSAGAAYALANPKSAISQIKRFIGRQYKEPSVQEELKLLPFVTSEGPRGGILIELEYMKEKLTFTPVEILGMLFKHLKQIAEKNIESAVVDCVIGIPSYFTDLQRREYLDAAFIAGLNTLMLMHDGTATALGYGIYKTDLSDKGPTIVVFVDIGHCDTQVTVAAFEQGGMKVLSHASDQNLGGRDFDEVLFKHFADKFKEQYNIDVYSNPRACIRLRASCEKLKKVLSANTEAPLSIECLIEDINVRGIITREEFEHLSRELLERVAEPCIKAVNESGINPNKIYTIELVGSGSRIPAIAKLLTSIFRKEPTRTLNASECVARGCTLRCAMLSPTLRVRDYEVQDCFPYSIGIRLDDGDNIKYRAITAIPKCSPFPVGKTVTHFANTTFYFHIYYINETDLSAGISPKVGHFMMGPSHTSGAEKMKVLVKMELNKHGIVEIRFATALEDERPSQNVSLHSKKTLANKRTLNIAFSDNLDAATTKDELIKAQEREQKFLEQDEKVEQTKDQRNTLESIVYDTPSKYSWTNVTRTDRGAIKDFGVSENVLVERRQNKLREAQVTKQMPEEKDIQMEQTKEKIHGSELSGPVENENKDEIARQQSTKQMLNKLHEAQVTKQMLAETDLQVEQTKEKIHGSEALSYHNDEFKEADSGKLGNPIQLSCPVENKNEDENAREQAIKDMLTCLEEYRLVAGSLPPSQKEEVNIECNRVEQWLNDLSQQNLSNKNINPIRWSNIINNAMDSFERRCKHLMN